MRRGIELQQKILLEMAIFPLSLGRVSAVRTAARAGWSRGTFRTLADSLTYHVGKHGKAFGGDVGLYVERSVAFRNRTLSGKAGDITSSGVRSDGTTKYKSASGEWILLDKNGKIVTYGKDEIKTGSRLPRPE